MAFAIEQLEFWEKSQIEAKLDELKAEITDLRKALFARINQTKKMIELSDGVLAATTDRLGELETHFGLAEVRLLEKEVG